MPLTDVKIRQAKPTDKQQKLADSGGLFLLIMPSGSKLWRYRYEIGKKENVYAIGEYPTLSLGEAREERDVARKLVKQGVHPAHERARLKATQLASNEDTFRAIADDWIAKNKARWSAYYCTQIVSYFDRDVYPKIGSRPMRSITARDVLDILDSIVDRGATAAAINVRQWISSTFIWAIGRNKADADPAAAARRAIVRGPITHAAAMTEAEIAEFVRRLADFGGARRTALALHLMLLLFPRTAELRKAEPSQFELGREPVWRVPVGIMKKRRLHLVPLPAQAVPLVKELIEQAGKGKWMFPNMRDPKTCMSGTTLNRALEYLGYASGERSGHDFRATASTHLHELGFRSELVEMQLAHVKKDKTAAAYNHAQYLPERRQMMQAWADHIDVIVKQHAPASAPQSKKAPPTRPSRKGSQA